MSTGVSRGVVIAAVVGIVTVGLAAQTVLSTVGLSDTDARITFMQSMIGMGSPGAATRPFLALGPSARAAAVVDAVAWAKAYAATPAFKKAWADQRTQNQPDAPLSDADAQTRQARDQQKQIDDMKKTIASLPADQQKQMQAMVDQMLVQQAAIEKDPSYQALVAQAAIESKARAAKDYADATTRWQQDYPADPTLLIARRLREFLAMSADVNFDAKLVTTGGRKTFADPSLEAKPAGWKMCFRAGREATAAARAAAQAWLKELGQ
jgi:hypothetical protein